MFIRYIAVLTAGLALGLLLWMKWQQQNHHLAAVVPIEDAAEPEVSLTHTADRSSAAAADTESVSSPESITTLTELDWVASDFEQQIQFPEQSRPIADQESLLKYQPNVSAPIVRETPVGRIELVTDKLRYSPDQTIQGKISLAGFAGAQDVRLRIMQDGINLATDMLQDVDDTVAFQFSPLGDLWRNDQIFVVADLTPAGEESISLSIPILRQDMSSDIQLMSSKNSYVKGAWLMMPLTVVVPSNGFFRLEANLYSEQTGQPLVHLLMESELTAGKRDMVLKAHIRALKAKQDSGDYILADFVLEKMPAPPDYTVQQGTVPEHPIPVQGFPFSDYVDDDAVDSDSIARLEFLRALAQ